MVKIKAIMAMDKNGIVGNGLELPWKNDPDTKWDMANFKKLTTNHIVLMGYHTYESLKKPLKNRLNLVCGRVSDTDEFYSVKDKKMVPNNLSVYIEAIKDRETYNYFTNLDNAKIIKDPEDLRKFLDFYWSLQEHEECVNNNNQNIEELKVNLTKSKLSSLYSFVPVNETDKRFVFIGNFNKEDYNWSLSQLNYTLKCAQSEVHANNEPLNDPEISAKGLDPILTEEDVKKIKAFDFSEVFVIGGAKTYKDMLPIIDEFYLTEFNKEYSGDIKFNKSLITDEFPNCEVVETHENGIIYKYYR